MNPLLAALLAAGIITPDDAERINRSLDPDAARAWAEQQMALAVQGGLSQQRQKLVQLIQAKGGPLSDDELAGVLYEEDDTLWRALQPALDEIALDRAAALAVHASQPDMWNTINQAVIDWSHNYYTGDNPDFVGSVRNLDQTSRQQVNEAFARWQRGDLADGRQGGLPALIAELEPTFGPDRAARIAATETTRIFAESENAAAMVDQDIELLEWGAVGDELVCAICGPLHGRQVRKGQPFAPGIMLPPAHPNCRCAVTGLTAPAAAQPKAPEDRFQFQPAGRT